MRPILSAVISKPPRLSHNLKEGSTADFPSFAEECSADRTTATYHHWELLVLETSIESEGYPFFAQE
jgi:hypothetical protein